MKSDRKIGLVGQGSLALSYLARLPSFLDGLALVKGTNERTSSRLRNALRAGQWVSDYRSFARIKMIWVAVSEDTLPAVLDDLAKHVKLAGKMIVLCDTLRDSAAFPVLTEAKTQVATLYLMPQAGERIFVAEGHATVLEEVRRMLVADRRKLIELAPGTKPLFLSGLHLCAHLLIPFAGAAVESFRLAGLSRTEATLALQAIGANALRAYIRGGDKALPRAEAEQMQNVLDESREVIRAFSPRIAELYDERPGQWMFYVGSKQFWSGSGKQDAARAAAAGATSLEKNTPAKAK